MAKIQAEKVIVRRVTEERMSDYPHVGPAYMVLETETLAQMQQAQANGVTHIYVKQAWDAAQSTEGGQVNASELNQKIAHAKDLGLKVTLEVSLQYPPNFVKAGVAKFKQQSGTEWDGAQGSGDQIRDWIWSRVGRGYVEDFLNKLFRQVHWGSVERVRLGGLQKGELQFPGLGQSPEWWAYSPAAQGDAPLAVGMSAAPKKGHIPSSGTTWNDDDENFYAWYSQSMNNWLSWLVGQHRKYFDGPIWVLHPGAGLRSVSQTPKSSTQGTNWRVNASKGLDWDLQIAAYPDSKVWPYSTWVDSGHFWPPAWASKVNDGNAAPWYHLLRVAQKYGRSGRIWGENTGGQSNAQMDEIFNTGALTFGYEGLVWLNHGMLTSGSGATYENLLTNIRK